MSVTTTITPFTTSPSRQQPATFSADMDTRLSEENSRITEMNSVGSEMNTTASGINTDVTAIADVTADLAKGIGTNQPTDSAILNALTNADISIAAAAVSQQVLDLTTSTETLSEGASATSSYDANTGIMAFGIPTGVTGADGASFNPDASGLLANRTTYDAEDTNFSYLATDTNDIYFKHSATVGDWSSAVPFGVTLSDALIKTGYENNADTNAFTDAEKTKIAGDVTLAGNTFNGNTELVQTNASGELPAISGANLTNLPAGFADPMSTRGDVIVRDATNTTARLGLGTNGQVLGSDGTDIAWVDDQGIGEFISTSIAISSDDSALLVDNGTSNYNIGIGANAGTSVTTGAYNVAIGGFCFTENVTGTGNVAIGPDTAKYTTGSYNTAVGTGALAGTTAISTGSSNVTVGFNAGNDLTTGGSNTLIGPHAGSILTTGNTNILIGGNAGSNLTTQNNQLRIGSSEEALGSIIEADMTAATLSVNGALTAVSFTGDGSALTGLPSGIGEYISTSIAISSDNTALAVDDGTTNYNIGMGKNAGLAITTGDNNTCLGYNSGNSIVTGSQNITIGNYAGTNTTGSENISIGSYAGSGDSGGSTGTTNINIGVLSGSALTSGGYNVLLGYKAGNNITTESNQLRIGDSTTGSLIEGDFTLDTVTINGDVTATSFTGDGSGLTGLSSGFTDPMTTRGDIILRDATNTTARFAVGTAGQTLSSDGTDIVWAAPVVPGIGEFLGTSIAISHDDSALSSDDGTNANIGIGWNAGVNITTGSTSIAIGAYALASNISSFDNTAIGSDAGIYMLGGSNTAIGADALRGNATTFTGAFNVGVGPLTGNILTTGGYNVLLGYKAGNDLTTESNQLRIGDSTTASLIEGDFTAATVDINGALTATNLSGTNTGDQSSIVGITGTIAQFNTAVTDADIQPYDADTAKTDVAQTFTAPQRTSTTGTDNSITFDSNNNITLTATAANITVTSQTIGQGGTIIITTASNITGWGTEFDWGNAGEPASYNATDTFAYYISGASGADSIKIGRL